MKTKENIEAAVSAILHLQKEKSESVKGLIMAGKAKIAQMKIDEYGGVSVGDYICVQSLSESTLTYMHVEKIRVKFEDYLESKGLFTVATFTGYGMTVKVGGNDAPELTVGLRTIKRNPKTLRSCVNNKLTKQKFMDVMRHFMDQSLKDFEEPA